MTRDPRLVEPRRLEDEDGPGEAPYDPLRLCVFATVALLPGCWARRRS